MTDQEIEGQVVIEAAMDGLLKHFKDGTLRFCITIDPPHAQEFLRHFLEIGTPVFIAKRALPSSPRADQWSPAEIERMRTAAPVKINHTKGAFGEQAKALRLHTDWMGNPRVWAAFGTDADFLEWCQLQSCPWESGDHGGDVVAAHVRRVANGAGVGIKPQFSAIPLCHTHHDLQHRHGEGAALGGKEWFDRQRMKHVHDWLWHAMKVTLGAASMSQVAPSELLSYAEASDIAQYLPECYRSG